MPKPKTTFSDYWKGIGVGDTPFRGYKDATVDQTATVANYEYLLAALRSKAPGQWSQDVLELSNHFKSAAFLGINTMATQAADAEMKIYERTPDPNEADVELDPTEPVVRLFEDPNNDDSWGDLAYMISQQLGLTGLGLIWNPTYYQYQQPDELYSISTSSALPWPPSAIYPHGSYLIQPYYPFGPFSTVPSYQSAAGARIPAEQILRIKNHHPVLRYDGYAVLTAIRNQEDTIERIDEARLNTQIKGVDPTLMINFDPELFNPATEDFKRLRIQLEALYSGPMNAGRIMFNPFGGTVTSVSKTPAEMAWAEGWKQLVDFTLACYGTPSVITGMSEAGSFATLIAALKQYHLISLNPLLKKISNRFNKGLIRPHFGLDLYMKLKGSQIQDEETEIKKFQTVAPMGVVKRNEARKFADLTPLSGAEGDEFVTSGKPTTGGKEVEDLDSQQDHEIEQHRPENISGEGTKGPRPTFGTRKNFKSNKERQEAFATLLERMKVRGTIQNGEPRKSYLTNGTGK